MLICYNINAECDCEPPLTEDAHHYVTIDPLSGYPLTIIKNNGAYDLSEEITTIIMLYNINDVLNSYGFLSCIQFYSIEQQIITIPAAVSATLVQ